MISYVCEAKPSMSVNNYTSKSEEVYQESRSVSAKYVWSVPRYHTSKRSKNGLYHAKETEINSVLRTCFILQNKIDIL